MIEEKVLLNVLRQISKNEIPTGAPDSEYVKALDTIGLIKCGWNNEITAMGKSIMEYLDNKINPWQ